MGGPRYARALRALAPLGSPPRCRTKIQEARENFHQGLIDRFDSDLPYEVKQYWFVAAMLDPRVNDQELQELLARILDRSARFSPALRAGS